MPLTVTNPTVFAAQFQLGRNQRALDTSLLRLATGKRINAGKDGPAALISAEQLNAQIKALEAESDSIQRNYARANISDGQLGELSGLLGEINALVVAGANEGGLSDEEQAAYQGQIDSLVSRVQTVAGDAVESLGALGIPDGGSDDLAALVSSAATAVSGLAGGGDLSLASGEFEAAQDTISAAITDVASARGQLGGYQRYTLEPRLRIGQIEHQNLSAARSQLVDTDYAEETSRLNRYQVLTAAGISVLAIAQRQGAQILDLFETL
jgi:flagellin